MDIKSIREQFPVLKRGEVVYLDSAATSLTPGCVVEAVSDFELNHRSNIGRSSHKLAKVAGELVERSRETIAKFICAEPENIILVRNSTEACNLVAYAYPWSASDKIVTTLLEHHSNYLPWIETAKRHNLKIEIARPNTDDYNDNEPYIKSIGDDTTMFAITGMSNVLGVIPRLEELTDFCRKNSTLTFIDAAQLAPHRKIDVKQLDCDFLCFSSYKICGPFGLGALYVKDPDVLKPFLTGGGMIEKVEGTSFIPAKPPGGFEAGTQPLSQVVGFARALEFLLDLGWEEIEKHERELFNYASSRFKDYNFLHLHTPIGRGDIAPIFSFTSERLSPHQLASMYDEFGDIALRSGHMCALPLHQEVLMQVKGSVRASLAFYNNLEDLERFFEATDKIEEFLE